MFAFGVDNFSKFKHRKYVVFSVVYQAKWSRKQLQGSFTEDAF